MLWVSHLIKTERENCCDDLALNNSTSKHNYIQALVSCEEYRQANPTYAVAFSGQNNSLISRVKRLVNNRNHSLNAFDKALLTICLVISGLCLSAFAEKETIKKTIHQVVNAISHKQERSKRVAEIVVPAAVKLKPILGQTDTVPKSAREQAELNEAAWFKPTDSLNKNIQTGRRVIRDTNTVTSFSVTTSSKINLKELMKLDSAGSSTPLKPLPTTAANKPNNTTGVIWAEMVKDGLMKENHPVPFSIDENSFVVNGVKQPEALAQKYLALSKNGLSHRVDPTQNRSTMNKIILEMAKDKLFTAGEDNFSFKLNSDEFIINGKKQPDDVFQKYLNDFVKKAPGGAISWSYSDVRTK
ncbi:hypothetical protein [Mucilaginibacter sp. HD30]